MNIPISKLVPNTLPVPPTVPYIPQHNQSFKAPYLPPSYQYSPNYMMYPPHTMSMNNNLHLPFQVPNIPPQVSNSQNFMFNPYMYYNPVSQVPFTPTSPSIPADISLLTSLSRKEDIKSKVEGKGEGESMNEGAVHNRLI